MTVLGCFEKEKEKREKKRERSSITKTAFFYLLLYIQKMTHAERLG